ncbi:MAG: NAD(P)-dependent oxidoreductase [Bacillota bacterium]|nr:NAD(P)-dependent oxidoreductase [Bacillota bacterium]MDW7676529.1 NAD(P)-dependent oxidoreductase [Bacillota bacterium]
MGSEVAVRMKGFSCRVGGLNPSGKMQPAFDQCMPTSELTTFLRQSDVVVLTLPLTEDTRHLIDNDARWSMEETAVLTKEVDC